MKGTEWKNGQNGSLVLFLGTIRVGLVIFDGCRSAQDAAKYKVTCAMPGVKDFLGHYLTVESAQAKLEAALAVWMSKAGVRIA